MTPREEERAGSDEVILISYYFPPLAGMGSLRAARFARALAVHGWRPRILTVRDGRHPRLAEGEADVSSVEVARAPALEWRGRRSGTTPPTGGEQSTLPRVMREMARRVLYVPDARIGWYPFAVRAGREMLITPGEGRRLLYSSSVPYTGHLVARRLAREFSLPWVAEFRDLWVGGQGWDAVPSARKAVDRRVETAIVREADAVVLTTAEARDSVLARHPGLSPDRAHVVTNAFDPTERDPWYPPRPALHLELVHPGSLAPDGSQDPAPLLAAMAEVCRGDPGAVRLTVLGPPGPWAEAAARVGLADHALELRGSVPAGDVPGHLAQASAMVIVSPGEAYREVIPGKAYEWLGSGMPLLALAHPRGALARLVQEAGGGEVVSHDDVPAIAGAIERLLGRQRAGGLGVCVPDPAIAAEYALPVVAERLAALLRVTHDSRRPHHASPRTSPVEDP